MPSKQRRPQVVGSDHSVFPEGVPVTADELPRERTSTVTGRAAANAIQDALLGGKNTPQGR